eukprot:CAMPEP_0196658594 /NCGR_PEP_ID=MMETSP1086-20130531/30491_1 /TAXON_ID=77921 /ORGANISM="Cyanoptyche  gloeocystis , Strain SAG4.97" /LENGTH=67 /DNA_ID=CAMNT_0041992233 /DNA_START=62 /DNA_END=265 /DNA_ORIENTATION=+
MAIEKDYYVEQWAYFRENTHKTFKLDRRAVLIGGIFLVGIPWALYSVAKNEMQTADVNAGRPKRDFL